MELSISSLFCICVSFFVHTYQHNMFFLKDSCSKPLLIRVIRVIRYTHTLFKINTLEHGDKRLFKIIPLWRMEGSHTSLLFVNHGQNTYKHGYDFCQTVNETIRICLLYLDKIMKTLSTQIDVYCTNGSYTDCNTYRHILEYAQTKYNFQYHLTW